MLSCSRISGDSETNGFYTTILFLPLLYILFVAHVPIQSKMVVLSQESGNEVKLVLMIFCHVDA